jgi:hypothetical protein
MKKHLTNDTQPIAVAAARNIAVGAAKLTIAIATNALALTAKKSR